ncbi:YggT family protein [Patescibacteria group bacterium]|nr:YggT family protein [Patescibacteria group bacterium]
MISTDLILGMLNLLVVFAEGIVGTRILLKMMGASTSAPFVRWVYNTSRPLLSPFEGMFPSQTLRGPLTIEFSAIFALFAYMFLGYVIQEIISFFNQRYINAGRSRKRKEQEEV